MEYKIYKLEFLNGVHFGKNSLESTEYIFQADTFFSALCIEALHRGEEVFELLLDNVQKNKLLFSDAFPYINETFYLPRPMLHIERETDKGDSKIKKIMKKMSYIAIDDFDDYLCGKIQLEHAEELKRLGKMMTKVSASVRGEEETVPYRVGVYYFNESCGLYVIVGYDGEDVLDLFEELLEGLSFSGIGGKRNSGLGRFDYYKANVPSELDKRLNSSSDYVMTLSVSLPAEEELESVMENASYLLEKRSGFVASENYAESQMRKKDMYVFKSGACFKKRFSGNVYDVSVGGNHSVYRYAKPLFVEVSV